jgi:hypothetical protein
VPRYIIVYQKDGVHKIAKWQVKIIFVRVDN